MITGAADGAAAVCDEVDEDGVRVDEDPNDIATWVGFAAEKTVKDGFSTPGSGGNSSANAIEGAVAAAGAPDPEPGLDLEPPDPGLPCEG